MLSVYHGECVLWDLNVDLKWFDHHHLSAAVLFSISCARWTLTSVWTKLCAPIFLDHWWMNLILSTSCCQMSAWFVCRYLTLYVVKRASTCLQLVAKTALSTCGKSIMRKYCWRMTYFNFKIIEFSLLINLYVCSWLANVEINLDMQRSW